MSYITQRYYGNHAIPQIKTENYQEINCQETCVNCELTDIIS